MLQITLTVAALIRLRGCPGHGKWIVATFFAGDFTVDFPIAGFDTLPLQRWSKFKAPRNCCGHETGVGNPHRSFSLGDFSLVPLHRTCSRRRQAGQVDEAASISTLPTPLCMASAVWLLYLFSICPVAAHHPSTLSSGEASQSRMT